MPEDAIWIFGGIVLTALVSVVGVLWKIVLKSKDDSEKSKIKLEAKYEDSQEEHKVILKEVGELKGRIHFAEELSPKITNIEALTRQVLEEVTKNPS
ncbi:MAG: hypothetical protein ACSHX0_06940 [Akkermansiaceae bacterium]